MAHDVRILRARPADVEAIEQICQSAEVRAEYFSTGRAPSGERYRVHLACAVADDDHGRFVLVARSSAGVVVGFLVCDQGRISYAVVKAWRGRGVGRALLHRACRHAQRLGCPEQLVALVARSNVASRRLLEASGFRFLGPHPCPATTGRPGLALAYRWTAAMVPSPSVGRSGEMTVTS